MLVPDETALSTFAGDTASMIDTTQGQSMVDRDYDGGLGLARPANGAQRLDRGEAMRLLASVDYGRVVFTLNALPAVRPVNHLVDDDQIIIRTRLSAAISTVVRSADPGVVVAYEADQFDPQRRAGWSVVATGYARTRSRATNNCCIRGSITPTLCLPSHQMSSPASGSSRAANQRDGADRTKPRL
jgi:hypothetical protein